MKLLFYRYGNICEPDIIDAFQSLDIRVIEECAEIHNKTLSPGERVALLQEQIQNCGEKEPFLFIFSVNYFPAIAEFCHIIKLPYVCWTVDCPVLELFSRSIAYDTNYIFLFDYAQYEYYHPQNPEHIFYLPLATNVARWDKVRSDSANASKNGQYAETISFVGSLYSEKCKYNTIKDQLPAYTQGFITGLLNAQMRLYGCNILEKSLNENVIQDLKAAASNFYQAEDSFTNTDAFVAANDYLGYKLAEQERIQTLNALGKHFPVTIYTRSNTECLQKVTVKSGVKTLTEMPFVFANSKINLNITMRPIQTGLSLRVYDIMGCCGFLMTNYQAELPEYFEIGKDLEAYGSMEELLDKCQYYLNHEEQRAAIARSGYEKVRQFHTYEKRIQSMIMEIGKRL